MSLFALYRQSTSGFTKTKYRSQAVAQNIGFLGQNVFDLKKFHNFRQVVANVTFCLETPQMDKLKLVSTDTFVHAIICDRAEPQNVVHYTSFCCT